MVHRPFVALFLTCLVIHGFAAEPASPNTTAVVYAGKDTYIGETRVLDTMALFPNESVETRGGEFSSVILPGTSIRVLERSQITYLVDSAELLHGQVSVNTSTRFLLKSNCFSVQPTSPATARFDVVPHEGRIYIAVQQGELLIKARREFRVPAGKTAVITGCGTLGEKIVIAGSSNIALKFLAGGAAAAGVFTDIFLPGKQCISADGPTGCR